MYFKIYKNIHCYSFKNNAELEDLLTNLLSNENSKFYSIAINAEKLIRCDENLEFSRIVESSALPIPDGIIAKYLIWRRHKVLTKRIDLPQLVIDYSVKHNIKLGIIGSTKQNLNAAIHNIQRLYPSINVVVGLNGYEDPEFIIRSLKETKPRLLLLGLGSPRQEIMSHRIMNDEDLAVGIINCGGAIDILSGAKKRAPKIIQFLGAETVYRLIQEPSRIKRYFSLYKIYKFL